MLKGRLRRQRISWQTPQHLTPRSELITSYDSYLHEDQEFASSRGRGPTCYRNDGCQEPSRHKAGSSSNWCSSPNCVPAPCQASAGYDLEEALGEACTDWLDSRGVQSTGFNCGTPCL